MIEKDDMDYLEQVFVTRKECDNITGDIKNKLADDNAELGKIGTKVDTIVWVSKTTLAAVIGAVIAAVMAMILK